MRDDEPTADAHLSGEVSFGGPSRPAPALAPPGYEFLGELGRGGMGVVYRARQVALGREVALKAVLSGAHAGPLERERFAREARAAASLAHPGVVTLFEVGEHDGVPFVTFELVAGGSLAARLDGTPWEPGRAASLVAAVARAVGHAHSRGVVHRDIKPGNILLDAGGAPKVSDFGLAKQFGSGSTTERPRTATGAILGTPGYMAPEQASGGAREVGPPADVYALGAVLYELLVGRPPFVGTTPLETLIQVVQDEPVAPRLLRPRLPRDLDTVVLKCLHKDPARRYADADALADDLERFGRGEPVSARPAGALERGRRWLRRHPAAGLVSAVLLVALVAGLGLVADTNARLRVAASAVAAEARAAREALASAEAERATAEERRREAVAASALAESRRAEAERQARLARESGEGARRGLFALQLTQASALARRDPRRAAAALDDPSRCPADLRDWCWRALSGDCRRRVWLAAGHAGPVSVLHTSSDGSRLFSGSWDGTVRAWSALGAPLGILGSHDGLVLALALSSDGRMLASAGEDRVVRLWDAGRTTGPPLAEGRGHADTVRGLVFAADGRTLWSASADGKVLRWPVGASGGLAAPALALDGRGRLTGMALSADAARLALSFEAGDVRLFRRAGDDWTRAAEARQPEPAAGLDFAPDGRTLATGTAGESGTVRLWDADTGESRGVLSGHLSAAFAVRFAPGGRLLATSGLDGTLRLWDGSTEVLALGEAGARVRSLAFAPDGGTLYSGSMDGAIRAWRLTRPELVARLRPAGGSLSAAAFDPATNRWAAADVGGNVTLHGAAGEPASRLEGQLGPVNALDLSTTECLAGGADGGVRAWPLEPPAAAIRPSWSAELPGGVVRAVLLGPFGRAASGDGGLAVWPPGAESPRRPASATLSGRVQALAASPDGRRLIAASGPSLEWLDASTLATVASAECGAAVTALRASAERLYAGDAGGRVWAWKLDPATGLPDGTPPASQPTHDGAVTYLSLSADGRTLFGGGRDRAVRALDPVTLVERAALSGHAGPVLAAGEANGVLRAAGADGALRAWGP